MQRFEAQLLVDKRREPRLRADGPVTIAPDDPTVGRHFVGELLDVSDSGFRVRHDCAAFYTGLEVTFAHAIGKGRARVVWNRILGSNVESGFLVTGRAGAKV